MKSRAVKIWLSVIAGVVLAAASPASPYHPEVRVLVFGVWALVAYGVFTLIQILTRFWRSRRRVGHVARGVWRRVHSQATATLSKLEDEGR